MNLFWPLEIRTCLDFKSPHFVNRYIFSCSRIQDYYLSNILIYRLCNIENLAFKLVLGQKYMFYFSRPHFCDIVHNCSVDEYSNHLNTEHLKSKHLTFQTLFCTVFKWSDHVIRLNIWILNILDRKTHFFVWFSDHPAKSRPFDNRTHLDHMNTRLVWYSDGYCYAKICPKM